MVEERIQKIDIVSNMNVILGAWNFFLNQRSAASSCKDIEIIQTSVCNKNSVPFNNIHNLIPAWSTYYVDIIYMCIVYISYQELR